MLSVIALRTMTTVKVHLYLGLLKQASNHRLEYVQFSDSLVQMLFKSEKVTVKFLQIISCHYERTKS